MSPTVARRHFQQLLEAKQARVRQGPSYPPANAFTGQHEATATPAPAGDTPVPDAERPDPEATFGSPVSSHGRGNQGMRPQK